jgi:hypothetical protein
MPSRAIPRKKEATNPRGRVISARIPHDHFRAIALFCLEQNITYQNYLSSLIEADLARRSKLTARRAKRSNGTTTTRQKAKA